MSYSRWSDSRWYTFWSSRRSHPLYGSNKIIAFDPIQVIFEQLFKALKIKEISKFLNKILTNQ